MREEFQTAQGVWVAFAGEVETGYRAEKGPGETVFTISLTATRQEELLRRFCRGIQEPAYFTLELPVLEDGEVLEEDGAALYDVYYLDGCTRPVLAALLDRYAGLLCADGLVRFGFAAHDMRDEIYVSDYKVIQIYTAVPRRSEQVLADMSIPPKENLRTLWDMVDEKSPAELTLVEAEDEWMFDIPENLREAGMYLSSRRKIPL